MGCLKQLFLSIERGRLWRHGVCCCFFLMVLLGMQAGFAGDVCSSVKYAAPSTASNAIEFVFEQDYICGQFANGDWWVTDPAGQAVRIREIYPKAKSGRNGFEINPMHNDKQGFDHRIAHYDPALVPTLPMSLPARAVTSVVKTASVKNRSCKVCVQFAAVLTIVPEELPDSWALLRPGYFSENKDFYDSRTLDVSVLGKLEHRFALERGKVSFAWIAQRYRHVQLDHLMGWYGRAMHPIDNMPDYGADIARDNALVVLRFLLDDFDAHQPVARRALINYLQMSIDLKSMLAGGVQWRADGGHGNGRKLPLLFAGKLFHDPVFFELVNKTDFSEDLQVYLSPVNNLALFGRKCSDEAYWSNMRFNRGAKDCRDPYGLIDGGGKHIGEAYQFCCTAKPWKYTALAASLLDIAQLWNNPAFFTYVRRWVAKGVHAAPDDCAPYNGDPAAYGRLYGLARQEKICVKGEGRALMMHEKHKDGGYYGHPFGERMWKVFSKGAFEPSIK